MKRSPAHRGPRVRLRRRTNWPRHGAAGRGARARPAGQIADPTTYWSETQSAGPGLTPQAHSRRGTRPAGQIADPTTYWSETQSAGPGAAPQAHGRRGRLQIRPPTGPKRNLPAQAQHPGHTAGWANRTTPPPASPGVPQAVTARDEAGSGRGRFVSPMRNSSMDAAAARPSAMAHTISDCPRPASPATKIPGTDEA